MEVVKKFFLKFVFTSQTRFGSQKWYPSNFLKVQRSHCHDLVRKQDQIFSRYNLDYTNLSRSICGEINDFNKPYFKNKYHSTITNWNK